MIWPHEHWSESSFVFGYHLFSDAVVLLWADADMRSALTGLFGLCNEDFELLDVAEQCVGHLFQVKPGALLARLQPVHQRPSQRGFSLNQRLLRDHGQRRKGGQHWGETHIWAEADARSLTYVSWAIKALFWDGWFCRGEPAFWQDNLDEYLYGPSSSDLTLTLTQILFYKLIKCGPDRQERTCSVSKCVFVTSRTRQRQTHFRMNTLALYWISMRSRRNKETKRTYVWLLWNIL